MTTDNAKATQYTIYHNPNCSKSRATLALLDEHNITPTVVDYRNSPPSKTALRELLALLKLKPRQIMRRKESVYADLNLDAEHLSDDDLLQVIEQHPILLERPIVIKEDASGQRAAAIGRPPENILQLL
ncbi:MAG: arsenate reductase (glutaredoxin) [bacterium]